MRLFTARRLIVLSLVVVLGSLAVSFRAEQRWDEARALGAQLEVAYDAIDHRRPVLVGEPVEGSAHAYYDRALVLLGDDAANRPQADEDFEGLARLCADEPEELAALRAELVETYGEALELLAEGARRTDGGAPFEWAAGFELGVPRLSSAGHLVTLAVADAELRLAAGESEAAVDRILQGAQFTGDLMRAPTWISMAVGQSLLAGSGRHVLLDPGLLERLPDDALARLERGLTRLEESLPDHTASTTGELALCIRGIDRGLAEGRVLSVDFDDLLETLPWAFSDRLYFADQVRSAAAGVALHHDLAGVDWPEVERLFEAVDEDEEHLFLPPANVRNMELAGRRALAQLRLTRASIAHRLTGEVPPLANPYGGELVLTATDDGPALEAPVVGAPEIRNVPSIALLSPTD